MKCNTCNKEYSPNCDFNQGRCPNHPSMADIIMNNSHRTRFYNLYHKIKNWVNSWNKPKG